jgi:hypothetical protein
MTTRQRLSTGTDGTRMLKCQTWKLASALSCSPFWFHHAHLMSTILPACLGDREVRYYCQPDTLKLKYLFDNQKFSLRHAVRLPL